MTTTTWPRNRTNEELVTDLRIIDGCANISEAMRSTLNVEIKRRAGESTSIPGSGDVTCPCEAHKDRCHFGRPHVWSVWYHNARLVRTRETFHCATCGAVCSADED